jgi:hypothetical protein
MLIASNFACLPAASHPARDMYVSERNKMSLEEIIPLISVASVGGGS